MAVTEIENSTNKIEVRPLSIHIGAEVSGVDIAAPLSDATIAEIRKALLRWKVVFFRDQNLDHESHVRFARYFGLPTPGHVVFGGDTLYPEIYSIGKHRTANAGRAPLKRSWTNWHTDITAAINPPAMAILRGETVPPYGGDTYWTNLTLAYDRLSEPMRSFLDGLRAHHQFTTPTGPVMADEYTQLTTHNEMISEHPLITVHPETGERVLYISPDFVKSIVGLTPEESQALLEMLWEHSVQTEFTVRFKWEPGSVAFWDNRSTAHLAPNDIYTTDFERQLYRVTLSGDPLQGIDGQPSKAISGDPIRAL